MVMRTTAAQATEQITLDWECHEERMYVVRDGGTLLYAGRKPLCGPELRAKGYPRGVSRGWEKVWVDDETGALID